MHDIFRNTFENQFLQQQHWHVIISFADLLSLQKKSGEGSAEENNGTALHKAAQLGNAVMLKGLLDGKSIWVDEEDGQGELIIFCCNFFLSSSKIKNYQLVKFMGEEIFSNSKLLPSSLGYFFLKQSMFFSSFLPMFLPLAEWRNSRNIVKR